MTTLTDEELEALNRELEALLGGVTYDIAVIRHAGSSGRSDLLSSLQVNAKSAERRAVRIRQVLSELDDHFYLEESP